MSCPPKPQVAIIGGGLCGLALAIALRNRSIAYKIYEARESLTQIGAGINLGPNLLRSFELIDKTLGREIENLCTKNPSGSETVWMHVRLGAATDRFSDAELITKLMAPPTGNSTVRRSDLLALLAARAGLEHVAFHKKLVELEQADRTVTLKFSDGTQEIAGAVIGCDGAHSAVRRAILGSGCPSAGPRFSECGAYRAVVPRERLEQAIGPEIARTSNMFVGPNAYAVTYPVDGEQSVNVGLWSWKRGSWVEHDWVLPAQKGAMEETFDKWGEIMHRIMGLMDNVSFFATYHHSIQPDSFHRGKVCLIGDAAHSMPPHQGAGAGQGMEDVYVLAEILGRIGTPDFTKGQLEEVFEAFEAIRMPRVQRVLDTSVEAMEFWSNCYHKGLTNEDIQGFVRRANDRFRWIWYEDIAHQAEMACKIMKKEP
ncbi:MAG: hypothetical protein Q9160_006288 [Pyrenula sp. 1 TL-2023]